MFWEGAGTPFGTVMYVETVWPLEVVGTPLLTARQWPLARSPRADLIILKRHLRSIPREITLSIGYALGINQSRCPMGLYGGLDVHSSNTRVGVMEGDGRRVYERRLANDAGQIVRQLHPMKADLVGLVVESTYNWYWLVDALMDEGYRVYLANPSAMKMYEGRKHTDDRHDAFWLADLLRLGVLPEGYIYPKHDKPVRDLLRKRGHLVRLRTSLLLSLHGIIARNCGVRLTGADMKVLSEDRVSAHLQHNEDLHLAGRVSKEAIDYFTVKIGEIEHFILGRAKMRDEYRGLLTMPGVGKVLGLTIMLETGPVGRFAGAGKLYV